MPSNLVSNMTAALGAGATLDVQPAAGQAYKINDVGNDVAFVANVPDVLVALRDGALADVIIRADPTIDPGKRTRPMELYIRNTDYMRLTNTGAGVGNVCFFGERIHPSDVNVITNLVAVGAGLTIEIQPPAGQTWKITEWGASVFDVVGDVNPDVSVGVTDGTLVASAIVDPNMVRGQDKEPDWYINNAVYLRVTDTSGGGLVFGYSGIVVPETAISSVQDVAGSATLDIQPPAGQEWEITEIAAETFNGGGAPNNYPDIMVSMMVGANLGEILEAGSVATSLLWNQKMSILIDNTHYLRITEVSTANNEVGILGRLKRSYS